MPIQKLIAGLGESVVFAFFWWRWTSPRGGAVEGIEADFSGPCGLGGYFSDSLLVDNKSVLAFLFVSLLNV